MFVTHRHRFLIVPLLALLTLTGVTPASASSANSASGTFTYTSSTFNSARQAGGNTIIDLSATVSYTGTFDGTSTVQGTLIFHPDGSATFHDVETFTGTVNGVRGIVTFNLAGSGPAGLFRGTDAIVRGTGDLANLHGVLMEDGIVQQPTGPVGTYTGQIQFRKP